MEIRNECRPVARRSSQGGLFKQNRGDNTSQEVCGSLSQQPEPGQPGAPGGYGRPCTCTKYPCCKPVPCKRKMRYVQPERPKSYAPIRAYQTPEQPIEDSTIYRKSYQPVQTEKPALIIPPNSIGLSTAKFSKDTIHKMSYPGWRNIKPPESIVPCRHDLMGRGPMQDVTTQKHDYVPKKIAKVEPFKPCHSIYSSSQPLTDKTINRLSYMPNYNIKKVEPIRPLPSLELPKSPLEDQTVHSMSYKPVPVLPKEFLPWAQKQKYKPPDQKMSGATIYKKSYLPNEKYKKVEAIRPERRKNFMGDGIQFETKTIYLMSYPGATGQRPDKIVPENSIRLSDQKMDGNTINKMSYRANPGYRPPAPIRPCAHSLLGAGPMTDITTQKHDYVPKPITKVQSFKPTPQITTNKAPMSGKTINKLSYQPTRAEVREKIVPSNNLMPSTEKMEGTTIHKMSYLPVGPQKKMYLPWAQKGKYKQPTIKFGGDTIYNMSYDAPGEFVDDGEADCGCHCAYENECCPCPCPPTAAVC